MRSSILLLLCLLYGSVTTYCTETAISNGESKFSIDYRDVEIREVLRDIADRQDLNLLIPDTLQGTTSIKLREVTWKQAFQVILAPVNYTWHEDGQIVKVVALEDHTDRTMHKVGTSSPLSKVFDFVSIAACFVVGVIALCHMALFFGVLRDSPPGGTLFAPKIVWAVLVLVGGILPMLGYWIIHHSILRPKAQMPNKSLEETSTAVMDAAEQPPRQP